MAAAYDLESLGVPSLPTHLDKLRADLERTPVDRFNPSKAEPLDFQIVQLKQTLLELINFVSKMDTQLQQLRSAQKEEPHGY